MMLNIRDWTTLALGKNLHLSHRLGWRERNGGGKGLALVGREEWRLPS
jgi:hypothetical protein